MHGELIDTFKLGYANKSLTYRLPPGYAKEGREVREKLQRVGVYRASGHEHLNGCLVVPVLDLETGDGVGNVRQLYGRRIAPGHKIPANQPKHLYLTLPLAGVWNEAALIASREVIVCEALIDAMTFWCAGYRNVIAAYGVNGFTQDHWAALKRHGTERVWIAYDRDDAGNAAAENLATELHEAGVETWRVLFPKGMDANEYARKVAPAEKSLGVLLQQAEWIGKGKRSASAAVVAPTPVEEVMKEDPLSSLAATAEPSEAPPLEPVERAKGEANEEANEATPAPPSTAQPLEEGDVQEAASGELVFTFGERVWRIRGWQKNLGPEQMRVNVQVRRTGVDGAYHVDTLDVYSAKARAQYLKAASVELGSQEDTVKRDLGRVQLKLETMQDEAIRATLSPKETRVELDALEHAAAVEWLKAPNLVERLEADMARCGVVGERTNLLAGYLAAVSRKLDAPLAVLIQSSSAAGKSSLMDAVLDLMPDEERIQYSAMTGQSLFYLGETDLQHKILAIAEEEGVRQAAYALKLLQSDGELTIASTGKDEATGNLVTKQYRVWFRWLVRNHRILSNPAADLDMPRVEKRLPKHVLSADEAERILNVADVTSSLGIRDRAILETFYSTGIRRAELVNLHVHDVDHERGAVMVREGKGKRDRLIPIGERALAWIRRYLDEVRPQIALGNDEGTLFLALTGDSIGTRSLGLLVSDYIKRSGVNKRGSCHLFRHTMATLMLENGADVRFVQVMLGHAQLTSTQVYTQVAIRALKEIHTATHPARLERREEAERIEQARPNRLLKRVYGKEALLGKAQAEGHARDGD